VLKLHEFSPEPALDSAVHGKGQFITGRTELMAGFLLGIAGFALNGFNLSLFFNVDFLFGSVFSMFALLRFGPASGLLAALIASSCTWFQWHHPWAIVIFSGEAIWAGWLMYRKRIDLMTGVIVYWFSGGLLLVWFFYNGIMGFNTGATLLVALKQGINGIINTLIAETLFMLSWRFISKSDELPSLRSWIRIILQGLVLIPAFMLAFVDINWQFRQQMFLLQQSTVRMAEVGKLTLSSFLSEWSKESDRRIRSQASLDHTTELLHGIAGKRDVTLTLIDSQRRVIASTQETAKFLQPFTLPDGGHLEQITDSVSQWIPEKKPGIGAMKRWLRSFYLIEVELAPETASHLVVTSSLAPALKEINNRTSLLLMILAALTLMTIALSNYFSRRLLVPITELGRVTSQLPDKIAQEEKIVWRPAEVREEEELQDNFRLMENALLQSFTELSAVNEELEKRVAERTAELQEREQQLSYVLKATGEGIWDWDLVSDNVRHNQSWCNILAIDDNYQEHQVSFFAERLHPDDRDAVFTAIQNALQGNGSYQSIHRMLSGDNRVIWVEDRGDVVERDPEGKPLRMAGSINDITARKHTEAELEFKQTQLEELNRTLQQRIEEAIAELRQKDQVLISQGRQAAMGEMIGNIAHQWRQPLNALSMLVSNLQFAQMNNELTSEYLDESAATANRLIQKMSTTINDFRNFFNPDKEKVVFSAIQQIRNAVELVDAAFKNSNIGIAIAAETDCHLHGFPNEYSQVLLNLLNNARDAIMDTVSLPGQITISITEQGGMGVVTVRDNGGGIPEAILDKIFEPYFSTKSMGTGIGLYMSKMIIERNMHGRLAVHTVEGGTEFVIFTPLGEKTS